MHLGQFDLCLALPAGGVLGEDVQDQRGAVDDFDLDDLLEGVQLGGAEFTFANDGVGTGRDHDLAQFLGLPRPDVGGRIGLVAPLDHAFENLRAGRLGQGGQFSQAGVGVRGRPLGPHPDQHNAFQPKLSVLDLGDVGELGRQAGHAAQRGAVFERQFTEARFGSGCR